MSQHDRNLFISKIDTGESVGARLQKAPLTQDLLQLSIRAVENNFAFDEEREAFIEKKSQ